VPAAPKPTAALKQEEPPQRLISLSENIKITQGGKPASFQNGYYVIRNGYFSIEVGFMVLKSNYISVFASFSNDIFLKYTFPVNADETVFSGGNSIARDRNTLYIRETEGYNTINTNEVIQKLSFENVPAPYPGIIYLTIYGDQNENGIIENEEIANIILEITGERVGTLFPIPRRVLPTRTPSPPETNTRYRVGDQGPAGGIVFYDKGRYSDGWRYLEAAPTDIPRQLTWGPRELRITGLGKGVGAGKPNTEFIIGQLERFNYPDNAVVLSWGYEVNGFVDWFLPSQDELELLYKNLYQKGKGGFKPEIYWSSTSPGVLSNNAPLPDTARAMLFENGGFGNPDKQTNAYVRPIRAF